MTKKEFIECSHIGNYGKGKNKLIAVFFDWKEGDYTNENGATCRFVGYKYMFAFRGITKKQVIDQVYQFLFNFSDVALNTMHTPVKTRLAVDDKNRFKVPLMM